MTEQLPAIRHWIGGEWAGSAQTSDSVNPATGEVIGTYADADAETGRAAIEAAAPRRLRGTVRGGSTRCSARPR